VATPQADLRLTLTDAPDDRAQAVIRGGLTEYNTEQAGYRDSRPLAVVLSDPETGEVIGGLLGRTSMGLLFVDLFFLPESVRKNRIGSRIIRMAEDEAKRRGCSRAVLFTVTFQAPGFYERQGYEVLGRIECDPPGHTRICMTKRLDAAPHRTGWQDELPTSSLTFC
jgi:GNAT superfamily N-acetyltransferase